VERYPIAATQDVQPNRAVHVAAIVLVELGSSISRLFKYRDPDPVDSFVPADVDSQSCPGLCDLEDDSLIVGSKEAKKCAHDRHGDLR
jgi:hypothetical protein